VEIISTIALFTLLGVIIFIANLAEQRRQQGEAYQVFAFISYGSLSLIYGLLLIDPTQILSGFAIYGIGIRFAALIGISLLIPFVRRLLAHVIPIDPANPVHTIALSYIMLVAINLMFTLGIGLNTLATMLEQRSASSQTVVTLADLWTQQILTVLLAFVGVGWLVRRDWKATLQRLGIVKPTWRQMLFGIGLGLLMVPLVMVIERVSNLFQISFDPNVGKLTEQLLGPLSRTPIGIFTIGAAAALGEETLLRGAVQPRFGLELTALVFALLHSTYGLSLSTLVVFVLGLVLGLVRNRANTSTSMIVHAVYNITLAVLAYLNISGV
jgi:uncharacterized protein